jgi:hypothetical protein
MTKKKECEADVETTITNSNLRLSNLDLPNMHSSSHQTPVDFFFRGVLCCALPALFLFLFFILFYVLLSFPSFGSKRSDFAVIPYHGFHALEGIVVVTLERLAF